MNLDKRRRSRIASLLMALLTASTSIAAQPAAWFHFDGNATNYGSVRAEWDLVNAPFQANTLYINGLYTTIDKAKANPEGFRAICQMGAVSKERFAIALRFKRDGGAENRHLIGGGSNKRWFGIQVSASGGLEVAFNNYRDVFPIEGVTMRDGEWNWLVCSADLPNRRCTVSLNGQRATPIVLPDGFQLDELYTPHSQIANSWTFSNYANGRAFCGWIDEFMVFNQSLAPDEIATIEKRADLLDPLKPVIPRDVTAGGRLTAKDLGERLGSVQMTSVGTTYSLAGKFDATYRWSATHITVKIARGEIIRQQRGAYPQRLINGFQLFLAKAGPTAERNLTAARSETVAVNAIIEHGQSVLIEDTTVEIPLRGVPIAELEDMWLGVQISDTPQPPGPQREGLCFLEAATCLSGKARGGR